MKVSDLFNIEYYYREKMHCLFRILIYESIDSKSTNGFIVEKMQSHGKMFSETLFK